MAHVSELPLPPVHAWSNIVSKKRAQVKSSASFWGLFLSILVALIWLSSLVLGFGTAVAMIAALGFTGAILGFRWPVLGLFSIGILAVHDNIIRACLADGTTLFRENSLNYLMLLTLLVYGWMLFKRRDPHTWWLMGIAALLTLELYMSPAAVKLGIPHVLNGLASFGFMIFIMRGVKDDDTWFWLALVNSVGSTVGGAMYFLQKASLEGVYHIDRNGLAYFFLTGIFSICLGFHFAGKHKYGTVLLGTLAAFSGCWLFLTASRGGMLIGMTAFVCLLAEIRGMTGRFVVLMIGALVVSTVLAKFAEQQLHSTARWNKMFDEERTLASRTSGRSDLLRGGLQIFAANPLGVGTGSFGLAYKEISRNQGDYTFGIDHEASAHSAWLKLLAENGFPGFLLLAGYVFSFVQVGWKKWKDGYFLLGLLATVALSVSFISSEFQGKGLWFLTAGVTVMMHRKITSPAPASLKKSRGL